MIVALIVGWVLAVIGWVAFWMAQDQVRELVKERDEFVDASLRNALEAARWEKRALDAEQNLEMVLDEVRS